MKKGYVINKEGILLAIICILLIFCRQGEYWKLFNEGSGRALYQLYTGDIQRCSKEWFAVLKEIEKSKEANVIIQMKGVPDTILKTPGLCGDESYWINQAIANYYGKETVRLEYVEEY